jgi:hypothetical protein
LLRFTFSYFSHRMGRLPSLLVDIGDCSGKEGQGGLGELASDAAPAAAARTETMIPYSEMIGDNAIVPSLCRAAD